MQTTEINWTELTWNPASGCTKVSAGCKYCYAEAIAEGKRGTVAFPVGFDVREKPAKLGEPARVQRPSLIFTNSMTDMFHADISDAYRDRICDVMREVDRHRYQVLTKRPENAERYFRTRKVPRSMWLGTTIEHQETAGRLRILRDIDAPVRFVSAEPLVGPLELGDTRGLHWLIAGGESGLHLMKPRELMIRGLVRKGEKGEANWVPRLDRAPWVQSLRDQCVDARIAFWFKQWGGPRPSSGGRMLDGRTWDQMPDQVPGAMPGGGYVHRQLPMFQAH